MIMSFLYNVALAATSDPGAVRDLGTLSEKIVTIINNYIIPVIGSLALLYFLIGVFQFIMNSDKEEEKSKGKNKMIWGIIALFVMISVWGLVNVLISTFNFANTGAVKLPKY